MTRTVSNAFKAAAFAQQTDEVWIVLLTLSHPDFTDDIRIASDPFEDLPTAGVKGVVSRGTEYIYMPFSLSLPNMDDTGVSRATISVDNIGRQVTAAIRSASSDVTIGIEVVLASDVDTVEISIPDFKLRSVSFDAYTVEGELSMEYFDLEPFPAGRFTPSGYIGLF